MSAISDLLTIESFARCSEDVDEADLNIFVKNEKVSFSDQQSMGNFLVAISEDGRLIQGLETGDGRKISRTQGLVERSLGIGDFGRVVFRFEVCGRL